MSAHHSHATSSAVAFDQFVCYFLLQPQNIYFFVVANIMFHYFSNTVFPAMIEPPPISTATMCAHILEILQELHVEQKVLETSLPESEEEARLKEESLKKIKRNIRINNALLIRALHECPDCSQH